jgi:CBS domain-containing protein
MPAARDALAGLTLDALRGHAPFDEMDEASLRFLAGKLALAYYPRGADILGPGSGPVDRLLIVKQGTVRGSPAAPGQASVDLLLGPGECFPISALIGRRPTVYDYRADSDAFCWELAAADFRVLLGRSSRFHAFCTDYLASMVERAHRAVRAEAGAALADGAGMLAPLRSVIPRAPVSCPPGTPVREVLRRMHDERIGSMVIADAAGTPLGIFTTVDVLAKVAAPQAAVDGPIEALMTPGPVALEEEATLADAATAMARYAIRHIVVTRDGRLAGVVSERDLFALQRTSLRRTSERIHTARSVEALAQAAEDIRVLARHLLANGVAPEQLTAMVSALNDALTQKVIALALAGHPLEGRWCWIALGSEGRVEQTFVTDQDNALIFAGDENPGSRREEFLRFADEVNRALAACGFPLCGGEIMARNPRWCLTAKEWRALFDGWIRQPNPDALLNASIFFDLRPLAGDARLAGELRAAVLEQTRSDRGFQRMLAENALRLAPPLGLLRDFAADEIDLKALGARPFVDAARALALAKGDAETGTAARLRAAGEPAAAESFHFVQGLRLRLGNAIRVSSLSPIERRLLKEAFRQSALLQSRLRLDFQL